MDGDVEEVHSDESIDADDGWSAVGFPDDFQCGGDHGDVVTQYRTQMAWLKLDLFRRPQIFLFMDMLGIVRLRFLQLNTVQLIRIFFCPGRLE